MNERVKCTLAVVGIFLFAHLFSATLVGLDDAEYHGNLYGKCDKYTIRAMYYTPTYWLGCYLGEPANERH